MELGDSTSTAMDAALDALNEALDTLITAVESGALERLKAEEKVAVWQRFETMRNQLPLVDHRLIADAESNDLPGEYCCSTLSQFLVRVLQLSHGEAASRVRAAAGLGPRLSMLGEKLEPVLPRLAALQRDGALSTEKVAIVERAMHKLSMPNVSGPSDAAT